MPERYDADSIARDLGVCRQRGLDWLDRNSTNQTPVRIDELQQLAGNYIAAKGLMTVGRIDQIKLVLRDGIEEFKNQGHSTDAGLIRGIFFGELMEGAIKPPGQLLKNVRATFGDNEATSRERRTAAIRSFARFLASWVGSMGMELAGSSKDIFGGPAESMRTGFIDNTHFLHMLTTATRVTIVGITNEGLLQMLQEALRRKRANGNEDAFWDSLRIVFLAENLLPGINDEREEINDPDEALRQRRQQAFWAHKSIGAYLKRTHAARWELHKTSYMPALTGSLFEFANHRKIVHQLIRRARRPATESLYIEIEDHEERFSAVFEDIVRHSASNENVPIGVPSDKIFVSRRLRVHSTVLRDGSGADGWLPMVLVVMTRRNGEQVEPVLQLRTAENSARELNRLSHLGGHVLEEDYADRDDRRRMRDWSFSFDSKIPALAAQRLMAEVAAIEPAEGLQHRTIGRYLYPDKEHLLFFVFSIDLPEGTQVPRRAEMRQVRLPDLLAIRKNQVLRSATELCRMPVSDRAWREAAELIALNLTLHDHAEIGDALRSLASHGRDERLLLADRFAGLVVEQAAPSWATVESKTHLVGLAGWQYREFFAKLLPLYEQLGVHGAASAMSAIRADQVKISAIERLRVMYQDEHLLAQVPMEL